MNVISNQLNKSDLIRQTLRYLLPLPVRQWLRINQSKTLSVYKQLINARLDFTNREGFTNFNFTLFEGRAKHGVTAMLRVKNEQGKIAYCLGSIIDSFNEIVLVDNGSDDSTVEIVRKLKSEIDHEDKIRLYSYPFRIARCGQEHLDTPEDSVHSLVYYYNWALSRCSFKYVSKWDGDMILRKEAKEALRKLFVKIQSDEKRCWQFYGQTIYRDIAGMLYLAKGEVNREIQLFPYGYNPRFFKVDLFEALLARPPLPVATLEEIAFYELKFASEDEFSHWSTEDIPTERKRREKQNFRLIKSGAISDTQFQQLPATFLQNQSEEFNEGVFEHAQTKPPIESRSSGST